MSKINSYHKNTENISQHNIELNAEKPVWLKTFDRFNTNDYALDICGGIKYLLLDEQCNIEPNQVTGYMRTIKQVTNMSGVEKSSNILLDFDPKYQTIQLHNILVYRDNDYIIDKIPSSDMQVLRREEALERQILSGDVALSILPHGIKIGDIIEFEYSIIQKKLLEVDFFNRFLNLQYSVPIYQKHLTIITNEDNPLQQKYLCPYNKKEPDNPKKLDIEHSNGKIIYSLNDKDIPAISNDEQDIPYWYRTIPFLQIGVQKSWQDIARQQAAYYRPVEISEPNLIKFIEKIKSDNLTPEKVVVSVLNFIGDNIRYFANDSSNHDYAKPADPNTTMKRFYGDCKGLVHLVKTMLHQFSIEALPVLVSIIHGRDLKNILPAINAFNHIILLIKINNKDYFIDPTNIRHKLNSLDNFYQSPLGYGLVCDDSTTDLIDTTSNQKIKNSITAEDNYEITSFKDKTIILKNKTTLKGFPAINFIQEMEHSSKKQIFESFQKVYNQLIKIQTVKNQKIDDSEIQNGIITTHSEYCATIPMNPHAKREHSYEICAFELLEFFKTPPSKERQFDYDYGPELNINYEIILKDGIKGPFKTAKKTATISNDAFTISKTIEAQRHLTKIYYTFEKKQRVIPREKYLEFCKQQEKASRLLFTPVNQKKTHFFLSIAIIFIVIGHLLYQIALKTGDNTTPDSGSTRQSIDTKMSAADKLDTYYDNYSKKRTYGYFYWRQMYNADT